MCDLLYVTGTISILPSIPSRTIGWRSQLLNMPWSPDSRTKLKMRLPSSTWKISIQTSHRIKCHKNT